jgi:hypothetical protein
MGLERNPLSLMSTIEELLGRKNSGFGLEHRDYGRGSPVRWPRGTLYPQNLALTWPASGGCSVGIVRSRIQATELYIILPFDAVQCITFAIKNFRKPCQPYTPAALYPPQTFFCF